MKLPWNKSDSQASSSAEEQATEPVELDAQNTSENEEHAKGNAAFTPKKGRPTPKRNEVERELGVRRTNVTPPSTPAEARARRKELKNSMSKAEYKAMKQRKKDEAARERRKANERIMAGDENYMLERDRGPEKRFVRDYVDSRRFIMNFFLPLTFLVIITMLVGTQNPDIARLTNLVMIVVFILIVGEGIWVGRRVKRMVNERFPQNSHGGFSLGMYAFTRATMIRRFRTPAPQKKIGDEV